MDSLETFPMMKSGIESPVHIVYQVVDVNLRRWVILNVINTAYIFGQFCLVFYKTVQHFQQGLPVSSGTLRWLWSNMHFIKFRCAYHKEHKPQYRNIV